MNEQSTRRIALGDLPPVSLFGQNDANLRIIRDQFGARVVARGNEIFLEGPADEVEAIAEILEHLMSVAQQGRYDEAIEVRLDILKTVPNHPMALFGLANAYYLKGMYEEAFAGVKTAFARLQDDPEAVEALERGYAEGGFRMAMSGLAEPMAAHARIGSGRVNCTDAAWAYALTGENDRALEWLERGFEERDPGMPYIGVWRIWDALHDEPRYQALLRRMNFPEDVIAGYLEENP